MIALQCCETLVLHELYQVTYCTVRAIITLASDIQYALKVGSILGSIP